MGRLHLSLAPALLLLSLGAGSARAEGSIRIPADLALEDASLTLGRIAVFEDVPLELARELQALSLGPAAAPSEARVLTGAGLRARIGALAPDVDLHVPDTVTVRRAHVEITPDWVRDRVARAIEAQSPWQGAAVELTDWRLPPRFAVPRNARGLRVHFGSDEDFVGRVGADVEFFDPLAPERSLSRRSASVEMHVRRPVVVADRDLDRNTTPDPSALRSELRDLRRVPHDALTDIDAALQQPLRRRVRAGTVLVADLFDAPPLVRRGDEIDVAAGGTGLEVRIAARALEPGRLGEVIRAENPTSRKSFAVKLTGPGTAVLAGSGERR